MTEASGAAGSGIVTTALGQVLVITTGLFCADP